MPTKIRTLECSFCFMFFFVVQMGKLCLKVNLFYEE